MNRKRRGELSELAFIYKATGLGFNVSKPYGDSSRYDFIVEHRGRLSKVQVKSTAQIFHTGHTGGYYLNCQRRMKCKTLPYLPGEVDFFAAYVIPQDIWYIIPLSVIGTKYYLLFYPHLPARDLRFAPYREAWQLLEGSAADTAVWPLPFPISIDACAATCQSEVQPGKPASFFSTGQPSRLEDAVPKYCSRHCGQGI